LAIGHARHSFAATLGTIDLPSIALARFALPLSAKNESLEALLSKR
jgi:hypothetical protein